jgi:hypothetical protein
VGSVEGSSLRLVRFAAVSIGNGDPPPGRISVATSRPRRARVARTPPGRGRENALGGAHGPLFGQSRPRDPGGVRLRSRTRDATLARAGMRTSSAGTGAHAGRRPRETRWPGHSLAPHAPVNRRRAEHIIATPSAAGMAGSVSRPTHPLLSRWGEFRPVIAARQTDSNTTIAGQPKRP